MNFGNMIVFITFISLDDKHWIEFDFKYKIPTLDVESVIWVQSSIRKKLKILRYKFNEYKNKKVIKKSSFL
jgi:hypothetical protein